MSRSLLLVAVARPIRKHPGVFIRRLSAGRFIQQDRRNEPVSRHWVSLRYLTYWPPTDE
jgi:hypothetical protein